MKFEIQTPLPDGSTEPRQMGDIRQFLHWLEQAPLANLEEVCSKITTEVHLANRSALSLNDRLQVLESCLGAILELHQQYQHRFSLNSSAFFARTRELTRIHQGMLAEVSLGYLMVLHELQQESGFLKSRRRFFLPLFRALYFLSLRVMVAYSNYQDPPRHTWHDIHGLYDMALELGCGKESLAGIPGVTTIDTLYKAIVVLALSDPFRLMHGEAQPVFDYTLAWIDHVHLLPARVGQPLAGQFYLASDRDQPPTYFGRRSQERARRGYFIDNHPLVEAAGTEARNLVKRFRKQHRNAPLPLNLKLQRDLCHRLETAWSGRRERRHDRKPAQAEIVSANGFHAAFHFVSGERRFDPELDELRINRISVEEDNFGLSLMPRDQESWKEEETEQQLESGVIEHRSSNFDQADPVVDVWLKIYATKARKQESHTDFPLTHWQVQDASPGGLRLKTQHAPQLHLRMGDILAFRATQGSAWRIGVISWIHNSDEVQIGLRGLSNDAQAIGVRAVSGTGRGSEYLRCFMIHTQSAPKLLAPAAIYDVQSVLAINDGQELNYIRLTTLLETSRVYSAFDFIREPTPETEQKRLDELRQSI